MQDKYGPDKLRVIWKNFPLPFHKAAKPAHEAAAVVYQLGGNKAFWKFEELAFANMKALTPSNFEKWAVASGVDAAKFKAAVAAGDGVRKVKDDMDKGKPLGVRGTPAFFINGKFQSGALPQQKFEVVVDEMIAQAEKLLASGTPRDKLYVTVSKQNFKKPQPPKPRKPPGPVYVAAADWSPRKGPQHAKVTIMEFLDFQ